MNYDLEDRTARFGESVIVFARKLTRDEINKSLLSQVIRSATSIGANYMEANEASSKKDFRNKIAICRKESNETKHWLRMLARSNPESKVDCKKLWVESHQLTLIFSKIMRSCDSEKLKN